MDRLTFDGNFCDIVMVFHALKEADERRAENDR